MRKFLKNKTFRISASVLVLVFLLYVSFVNHNEPTEIGIARNLISGEMWMQEGGWYVGPPWAWVSRIDTRPVRLAVTSAGRGYSAKLVQFQKDHWREFVAVEGWRYWWLANRISFNSGYDEEYRGMRDILRGYAYGAKRYPFIAVLAEYESR